MLLKISNLFIVKIVHKQNFSCLRIETATKNKTKNKFEKGLTTQNIFLC